MKRLIKLSHTTAKRGVARIPDGLAHARRCVAASQASNTYHSRMLLHQTGVREKDGALGNFFCVWLFDFAKPANFRVTQVTGGEMSYDDSDRWATIGDQHFEGLQIHLTGSPSNPGTRHKTNQFLTIDKWLELLAETQPVGAEMYRAYGCRYVLIEHRAGSPSRVFLEGLEPMGTAYRETVYAWIDDETGRLVKGMLEATMQLDTGEELPVRIQQVFAGYGHDMRFDPFLPFPR